MVRIREVYELKNGELLLIHTDGSTCSSVDEEKLFADVEKYGAHYENWTPNAYYDVQGIIDRRKRLERGQSA